MKLIQDAPYLYPIFQKRKKCMNNGTGPYPTNHDIYEAKIKTKKSGRYYTYILETVKDFLSKLCLYNA